MASKPSLIDCPPKAGVGSEKRKSSGLVLASPPAALIPLRTRPSPDWTTVFSKSTGKPSKFVPAVPTLLRRASPWESTPVSTTLPDRMKSRSAVELVVSSWGAKSKGFPSILKEVPACWTMSFNIVSSSSEALLCCRLSRSNSLEVGWGFAVCWTSVS